VVEAEVEARWKGVAMPDATAMERRDGRAAEWMILMFGGWGVGGGRGGGAVGMGSLDERLRWSC